MDPIFLISQENNSQNLFLPNKGGEFINVLDLRTSGDAHLLYSTGVNIITTDNVFQGLNLCNTAINNVIYEALINNYDLPNEQVKSISVAIYSFLHVKNIPQVNITPLSDGGIGFEFYDNLIYYNLKVDNESDGVFYKEEPGKDPQGWDLSFNSLLNKIKSEF